MRRLIVLALAAAIVLSLVACGSGGDKRLNEQRKESVSLRAATFARAEAAIPLPTTTNFPLRRVVAEMTKRDDLLNHPWYVYILGLNGNVIGYYVAKTDPVNACNFLSSTEDLHHDGDKGGFAITTAPSLDGIYYGGAGSASACDAWVFLDAATNALVKIRGLPFYVADQPLRIAAKPITVKGS